MSRCFFMRSAATLAVLVLSSAQPFGSAPPQAQTAGEAQRPSFRDQRRLVPGKAPEEQPAIEAPKSAAPPAPVAATAPLTPLAAPAAPAAAPVQKAAVTAPTNPALIKLGPGACGVPELGTEPLDGGRMRLAITSACRAGQDITWRYGGAEFQAKLDAAGKLELVIDCFAGATTPVDIRFADDTAFAQPVTANDLDRVTKIALIWRKPVDLDLHAFEYAARPTQAGHVWSGAAIPLDVARERSAKGPRGTGTITTSSRADATRDRLEVYTFFHRDGQAPGLVAIAVDHATRGPTPGGETCGSGALAEVPFMLVMHTPRAQVTRNSGILASASCDVALDAAARFHEAALPVLRIRP